MKITGVPMGAEGRPYFGDPQEAIRRCRENPACVGVSAQRLFYGSKDACRSHAPGRSGETHIYVKLSP
jgi:hypothetical protein